MNQTILRLELTPVTFAQANQFVSEKHRHHKRVVGHKFSIGVSFGGKLVGVLIAGRPVSRRRDNGETLEVTRCCTDGTPNACSKLYRAACRVAVNLGFKKIITYTLESENGSSLKGAGFNYCGKRRSGNWNVLSRERIDTAPSLQCPKSLWEIPLTQ
jgi:hypothetical protein